MGREEGSALPLPHALISGELVCDEEEVPATAAALAFALIFDNFVIPCLSLRLSSRLSALSFRLIIRFMLVH